MSFSSDVKRELAKQYSKTRHCRLAELKAMLQMDSHMEEGALILESDAPYFLEKCAILMKKLFAIDISDKISKEDSARILEELQNILVKESICCSRAYIRGAFLASGSVSDPNKSYHLEIVCKEETQAVVLQEIIQSFDMDPKIVERKKNYIVYLKDAAQIVDLLNVMEAHVSLMNLENVRIIKDMRNSINRKVNCETANISKTVNAAVKQIQDIEKIRENIGLDQLSPALKEMAMIRLEYPEAPLKELGTYFTPPIGKSGVNHRLRKLAELADTIQ